jgi:hypothetical protein
MTIKGLRRLRHDRQDVGFRAARVTSDDERLDHWSLHVESPADVDEFRVHLSTGASMSLSMVTREGSILRGEACVSTVSDGYDSATMVTLAGLGPLICA